jgi:hypothetical protein
VLVPSPVAVFHQGNEPNNKALLATP